MQGEPSAVDALAGEWIGSYHGDQTGRTGSITFRVSEDGDSAFGDVLMVPAQGIGLEQTGRWRVTRKRN